ncbi:hypothetical protein D7231_32015 [Streptomyces klenkii]|uniref:Uncharacterized protein n=1 Tax=Streptomyces klenkii TaxID=1420899 RepID=A0A3B0AML5_9ACTN|nr:hypothetical protein [Streptomyces klenkii]RKN61899.1 hypothetical protein D7231_32015 [Streptomyces klenkii]
MTTTTPVQHGERRCYLRGCQRPECRDAHRRYCKRYALRVVEQGPVRVDLRPAHDRVQAWYQQGYSQRQIALAAGGISEGVIQSILAGTINTLHPASARAILGARIEDAGQPGATRLDATGTRRRLQALAATGWPLIQVAQRAGMAHKTARDAVHGTHVYAATAHAIADTYDQLAHQAPEQHGVRQWVTDRTRKWARAHGWPDPTFWEDWGGIDDPAAPETEPEVSVSRAEVITEDALWLERHGYTRHQAAERLGVTKSYIDHSIQRAAARRQKEAA